MKKVAVINDISGFGKCSLVADIVVLSTLGIQACPLPTGVYTAQTGFKNYHYKSNTDMIDSFTESWSDMNISFDGIITGFLIDPLQGKKLLSFVRRFHEKDTLLLVDPVMGDGGQTYVNYSGELHETIFELAKEADILTPNVTELFLLTGEDISTVLELDPETLKEKIESLSKKLLNRPNKTIIVTGIKLTDGSGNPLLGNMVVTKDCSKLYTVSSGGGDFSGTGDLFAAAVLGQILNGKTAFEATKRTAEFIRASVADAHRSGTDPKFGTEFEMHLNML